MNHVSVALLSLLLASGGLSVAHLHLARQIAADTGLVQTFYTKPRFNTRPLFRRQSSVVDLAFLENEGNLPQRSFSVRWEGFWDLRSEGPVDIHAGGDDLVRVFVDDALVIERNRENGFHTIFRAVPLAPGVHRIKVEYAQYGGRTHLNVRWAPAGGGARAFRPETLFPDLPAAETLRAARRVSLLRSLATGAWIALGLTLISFVVVPRALRIVTRVRRGGIPPWLVAWVRACSAALAKTRDALVRRRVGARRGVRALVDVVAAADPGPTAIRPTRAVFGETAVAQVTIVSLFLAINAIVGYNALHHPPRVGYDAPAHLAYIDTLATSGLPTRTDTAEFYSPPLAYALPAAARGLANVSAERAAKLAQFLNVLLSLGLTLYILKLCDLIRPGDSLLKVGALGLCGMTAAYYKTFSQIRGETWLAFLGVVIVYEIARAIVVGSLTWRRYAILGVASGLVLLARQWGALLLVGAAACSTVVALRHRALRSRILQATLVAATIAFFVGGWYYVHLKQDYGSFLAFGKKTGGFSFSNQPESFYFGTGNGKLFSNPIRESFPNQLVPIFYSEVWGDYWEYFLVSGRDVVSGSCVAGIHLRSMIRDFRDRVYTNRQTIAAYLGRSNLLALLPSLILLGGLVLGVFALLHTALAPVLDSRQAGFALMAAVILVTVAGYAWFLVSFPSPGKGSNVKATYVIQVLPLASILGGELLVRLRSTSVSAFRLVVFGLAGVALHNSGTLFTRYTASLVGPCT